MRGLEGKTAIITGAAGGIGSAVGAALAEQGVHVVLADKLEGSIPAQIEAIAARGGSAAFCEADVTDEAQVERLVAFAVERFGRLDFALNNAGVLPRYLPIHEQTLENWNYGISVNLTGVLLCMKHEMRHMRENDGGGIVNVSSIGGVLARTNLSPYAASKRGVLALTECGAAEGGPVGIRVNAVLPGGIETEMLRAATGSSVQSSALVGRAPLGRAGLPSEIADVVKWLFSDESSYVTGQSVAVDGGAAKV